MVGENTMEVRILGHRRELDKFLAYAVQHAHKFASFERFTANGRSTLDPEQASVEVGTVDRPKLMRAYVEHVFMERMNAQIPALNEVVA